MQKNGFVRRSHGLASSGEQKAEIQESDYTKIEKIGYAAKYSYWLGAISIRGMKVWIVCFLLLFGMAELLQWFKQFSLPLPVFILGGIFLAIASNHDKLPFRLHQDEDLFPDDFPVVDVTDSTVSSRPSQVKSASEQPFQVSRPVSFTIHKPFQPGD
ncbi:MAG: hypothetical protein KME16_05530 [Scytolyngbya sp. HA4215-MV1]|nr:hypothetical protein [Scytolyngbya sp. HA4215-MV1]